MDGIVTVASSFRPLAILYILSVPVPALCRSTAREEAELLARAGEAEFRLAILRARRPNGRVGPKLGDAVRSLEEARRLDPANLRALAFLGLARLESGRLRRRGPATFEAAAFDSARKPLEEIFRLSRGWADPATRELLRFVAGRLEMTLGRPLAAPPAAVMWWHGWSKVVLEAAESAGTSADAAGALGVLRTSPFAWERERVVQEMASGGGPLPAVIEALAAALQKDDSPWVRAAAARALAALHAREWDLLLASAVGNDPSAWVRRTAARSLGARPNALGGRDGPSSRGSGFGHAGGPAALSPAALTALREALARDTPRVAAAAALSLGTTRTERVEKDLVAALGSPSPLVREAAALALCRPDSEEIKARLRSLSGDEDVRVRLAAARSLVRAGDRAVSGMLRSLEGSPVPLDTELYPDVATVGEAARGLLEALEPGEAGSQE